jgi:hypothetical protein
MEFCRIDPWTTGGHDTPMAELAGIATVNVWLLEMVKAPVASESVTGWQAG